MRKIFLLLSFFFILGSSSLFSQLFNWVNTSPNSRSGVRADVLGNTYTCGVTTGGGLGWSLEKFSPSGTLLWSSTDGFGVTNSSNLNQVAIDANGNVYAGGFVYTGATIAGNVVPVVGGLDYVLVKYDNQGVLQWSKLISGGGYDQWISTVEITSTGNVLIAGTHVNACTIDGILLNSSGYHIYWAVFTPAGVNVSVTESSITTASSWNATLDSNDDLYFCAFYNSQRSVMKFDLAANLLWSWSTGAGNGEFWDIAVDSNHDVYVTGSFDGTMDIGGVTHTTLSMWDDIYVIKVNANGQFGWCKQFGGMNTDQANSLVLDPYGHLFISGYYQSSADFDALSLGVVAGSYEVFFLSMDTTGAVRWVLNGGGSTADIGKEICYNAFSGHLFATGIASGPFSFGTFNTTSASDYGYLVSIVDSSCVSSGEVFRDMNANGALDAGDLPFAHRIVELNPGPHHANSGLGGLYELYSYTGSYTITLPNIPNYYNLTSPASQTATFTMLGQIDSLNHFALAPIPGMNDLQVTLTPYSYGARSGMTELYGITYENVGTTTLANVQIGFGFDPSLSFSGSNPPISSTVGADSVVWNVGTLAPGDYGLLNPFLFINGALGQPLTFHASANPIAGDQTPGDNVQSMGQMVVNSWDPNDKRVFPEGDITPAQVAAGTELTYTIRFQNTGNDTAFFVRLVDTLDADLDLSTFEFIAESHVSHWTISNGRVLTVDFEQINLVDSATNEMLSHGFFKYRATPLTTLPLGTQIVNRAHIYFDFNPAIITNDAVTTVANAIAVDRPSDASLLNVYPNPASGRVYFSWMDENPEAGCTVTLLDAQGKIVAIESLKGSVTSLSLSGIATGPYFFQLKDNKGTLLQSGKLVVE